MTWYEVTGGQDLDVYDRQLSMVDIMSMNLSCYLLVSDVMNGGQNGFMHHS